MNPDSNVADSSISASELAAVLESFKKALQSGDIQSDGASTFNFEDWLTRVDAQHRPSLAHHLTHLAEHHRAAMTETSDQLSTNLDFTGRFGFISSWFVCCRRNATDKGRSPSSRV